MRETSNTNGFMAFSTKGPFSNQNLRNSSNDSQLSHRLNQSKSRYFVACLHSAIQESPSSYYSFASYKHNHA